MSDQLTKMIDEIAPLEDLLKDIKGVIEDRRFPSSYESSCDSSLKGVKYGIIGYIESLEQIAVEDPLPNLISAAKSMKCNRDLVEEEGGEEAVLLLDLMQDIIAYHLEYIGEMPDPSSILSAAESNLYRRR